MIDIALIGTGPVAALHAQAIARVPGLRLASCAARHRDRAEAFAAAHGIPRARLFDEVAARPEADALWVVVPSRAMAEVACTLAPLGLPMFLEKPVGLTPAETAEARERVRVPHMVGLNRRFYEVIGRSRRLIEEAGGLRAIEIHLPENPRAAQHRFGEKELTTWAYGNSIHMLDLFRFLAGEVAQLHALNVERSWWDRGYSAVMSFEGGARGMLNAQWYAPGPWRLALYAEDLMIVHQPVEQATVLRPGRDAETIRPEGPDATLKSGFHGQAEAFARLLRGAAPDPRAADLAEYMRSVELVSRLTA